MSAKKGHIGPHGRRGKQSHLKRNRLLLLLLICIVGVGAFLVTGGFGSRCSGAIDVQVRAKNAVVIDWKNGKTLYQKNENEQIAPASTTKMLTALTVMDYWDTSDTMTVGSEIYMLERDASRAWITPYEELSVGQLLAAMLLPSGNDAAFTLAVNTGRKIADNLDLSPSAAADVFVDAMNKKAGELGAESSHFLRPDGYDKSGQYTTAADLAVIGQAFLENNDLAKLAGLPDYPYTAADGHSDAYLNTNELLDPESSVYDKRVMGLKTGNSKMAGHCVVSAVKIKGRVYICVVMNSSEDGRWNDSLAIYKALAQ